MKKGDLVRILSVFLKEHEEYIGNVGVLRAKAFGMGGIWGVYVGNITIYLADDRLELI
tara:strand:+ start:225 stop:398 length:174 start_codon:yes stop_codon:yes gene_type:complete